MLLSRLLVMGRCLLLAAAANLLLLGAAPAWAGPPRHYTLAGSDKAVALLTAGRALYVVTEHEVLQRQGRQLVRRYRSEARIRCALATDTALWLGTQQGLLHLSSESWQARPLPQLAALAASPITTLFEDTAGSLWIGALGYGAYQLQDGKLRPQLSVPTVNAGLQTADSAVWLATNIGLHRWHRGQWTRFNEEGVANHEIPDNIVEQLLTDNDGNLWVLMANGVSVFAAPLLPGAGAQPSHPHLPTVRYIGRPGNEVYSVVHLAKQGYVFATAMGLLLLPEPAPGQELLSFEPVADKVLTPQVLVPLRVPGAAASPTLLRVDARQRIWVAGPGGVSMWSGAAFRKATQPAAQAVAGR